MIDAVMNTVANHVQERVAAIQSDHRNGAVALARQAAEILVEISSVEPFQQLMEETCRALIRAQPSMAPIVNLANNALWNAMSPSALRTVCRQFTDGLDKASIRISKHVAELIHDQATVLTHSASRTVLTGLRAAHGSGKLFRVLCTESRPGCEGVEFARNLAEIGIPVTLAVDAALFGLTAQADIVLVGTDAITSQVMVNKTGTALLTMAARQLGRRVYVVGGSEKFIPAGYQLPDERPKPASEIATGLPPNMSVDNRYFESTPLGWMAGFLTEEGQLGSWQVRERLQRNELHSVLLNDNRR